MIQRVSCWLVAILVLSACGSQELKTPLALEWELLTEDFQGSGEVLSHLIITNHSRDTLRAGEWTIYHNSGSLMVADTATTEVAVEWINGDYNKIYPLDNWAALAPGDTRIVPLKIRNLRNLIHIPRGFYLVSANYPEGVSLSFHLRENHAMDAYEARVAEDVYHRNQLIRAVDETALPPVFPTPVHHVFKEGTFTLVAGVEIVAEDEFQAEAAYFQAQLGDFLSRTPTLKAGGEAGPTTIYMGRHDGLGEEGYRLNIDESGIVLEASTPRGMFYAVQSVKSMLPAQAWEGGQRSFELPYVYIEDEPRFGHRAFMMDVARNFQTKEQVFKILDLLAMYKINVFHFHLTEDEAWRLEIPGLEELTEVGARRGHTEDELDHIIPSYGSGPDPSQGYGSGYYTREDFIEILQYADALHIRVIPEIDTPGHARAAVKAMEARYERYMAQGDSVAAWQYLLSDPQDASTYRSAQAWTDNVMNVAMPSVYTFMGKVFDEVLSMYQDAGVYLETIHIGGDEVPNGVWTASPIVDEFLAANPAVPNVDELWYYYLDRIDQLLTERGMYLYGWEEVGMTKGMVNGRRMMVEEPRFGDRNFQVDVWNNLGANVDLAYRLANEGYQVVLTNVSNFYLDLAYNHGFFEMGHNWGGLVDVEKSFRFEPYDYFKSIVDDKTGEVIDQSTFDNRVRLTEEGRLNIVGIQAPLWSEYLIGPERMEYMLLPKLLGVAERAWSAAPAWEDVELGPAYDELYYHYWSVFLKQVGERELPRLDFLSGGFNYRIPSPGVMQANGQLHANVQIPNLTIHYTTDGSEPTAKSPVYTEPIEARGTVIFKTFNGQGRGSLPIKVRIP